MEKEQDYKEKYETFWKPLVEKNGELDKDSVMRELSDFHFMLQEVPKVYMEVTGGRISKVNTYSFEVIREFNERYHDKDITHDDVKDILESEQSDIEKLNDIKDYLEIK